MAHSIISPCQRSAESRDGRSWWIAANMRRAVACTRCSLVDKAAMCASPGAGTGLR